MSDVEREAENALGILEAWSDKKLFRMERRLRKAIAQLDAADLEALTPEQRQEHEQTVQMAHKLMALLAVEHLWRDIKNVDPLPDAQGEGEQNEH